LVVGAVATLPVRSCLIDGEAIVSDDSGLAVFELIRSWPTSISAVLCAFDLLEVDDEDLRRLPIEIRKTGLVQLLRTTSPGIALNEHYVGHGDIVYQQACKLRLRGHRLEAARLALSLRPLQTLGESQESDGTGSAARGRRTMALSRDCDRLARGDGVFPPGVT
jgi:hypothetical protein